jgi:hypothetical protein
MKNNNINLMTLVRKCDISAGLENCNRMAILNIKKWILSFSVSSRSKHKEHHSLVPRVHGKFKFFCKSFGSEDGFSVPFEG